jgi:hypothetical protein
VDVVTLAVAVVGAVLGAASLAWQAATFALSGSRVRVRMHRGAISSDGSRRISAPLEVSDDTWAAMQAQGFTRDVLIVEARNVGRMPVSVERTAIAADSGFGFEWAGDPTNPALPHRLEPGAKASWHTPLEAMWGVARVTGRVHRVWMTVELGNGKVLKTKESINIAP